MSEQLSAINAWTQIIGDPIELVTNLNQGYSFVINRNQFNTWNGITGVEFIHAYPAIFDGVMKFVVVDNVTDENIDINYNNVFTCDYTYGKTDKVYSIENEPSTNITIKDALERIFRWLMNRQGWIHTSISKSNAIFQAFNIPFSDLTTLFQTTTGDELYVLIGLQSSGIPELILWSDTVTFLDPRSVADVSLPIPPFGAAGESAYQLLVQSGQ